MARLGARRKYRLTSLSVFGYPLAMAKDSKGPRERILAVAARLFYEQGYRNTGINQIIAEAQVAKASFYQHFHSKQELGLAFLRQRHEGWFAALKTCVEAKEKPREKVMALFEYLEEWLPREQFRGCAFLNMAPEFPDEGTEIRRYISQHKQELREYVRNLVRDLEPGRAGATQLADVVFLLFEGAIIESSTLGDIWPVATARQASLGLLGGAS